MISNVAIKHFKCLRNVEIELERFTVFVGPNASGKSSILQALDLLCRAFRTDVGSVENELSQAISRDSNGPGSGRRTGRRREAGDAAEGDLEDRLETVRGHAGPLPRPGGAAPEGEAGEEGFTVHAAGGILATGQRGRGSRAAQGT